MSIFEMPINRVATSLSRAQGLVAEFHRKFRVRDGTYRNPKMGGQLIRSALIIEEAAETSVAILRGDLPKAVDGLCDLIYVCLGAAVYWGVDLSPIFEVVHAANMKKTGGGKRDDGKILKPKGWRAPDVAAMLRDQGWAG